MCMTYRLITLLLVFILVYILLDSKNQTKREHFDNSNDKSDGSSFDDLLFTDYKKDFVCSICLDRLPKHVRLHHSGNPMYISHKPPSEQLCRIVECPPNVVDDITPVEVDHYNPYRCPNSFRDNMTCWMCG